nr:MAG TPA: hypothetical protein [Caudoviricetes sp.]
MKYLEQIKTEIYKNTMVVNGYYVHSVEVWDYHTDKQGYEIRELYVKTLGMYMKVDIKQFWSRLFQPNDSHFTGIRLTKIEFENILHMYNDEEYDKSMQRMLENDK